jgi:penicillin V acylase-like amidase (Ntn superfamily)
LIINSNKKSKTIWNIVSNETGKYINNNHHHDPPPLTKNGKKINNCLHIANAFNSYFGIVMDNQSNGPHTNSGSNVNKDESSLYLTTVTMGPMSKFKHVPVTSNEVKDIIKLKSKNSYGYDEIS